MRNVKSPEMEKFAKSLDEQLEIQEINAKNQLKVLQKSFDALLNDSKIKDKRLLILLEEQTNATGEFKTRIKALTDSYINEQKTLGKLGKRESKKVEEILKKQEELYNQEMKEKRLTKSLNRREDLINPLNAFKFAMEDFKESRKEGKTKTQSIKEGVRTFGSGIVDSAKQQLTFKNFSKSLIHGMGIALDLPALNLLADKIGYDIQERKELNRDMFDLNERLTNVSEESSETLKASRDFTKDEAKVLANQESFVDEIKGLKEITKDMHRELNDDLMDIYLENADLTKFFKEYLYMQRDALDDQKKALGSKTASQIEASETKNKNEQKNDQKDGDTNILGGIGGLGDSKWGRKLKAGGKSIGTKLGAKGVLGKIAAPISALIAGYDKYSEVSEDQELTTAQKTTQVGATAVGAGGGALAGAAAGAAIGSVVPVVGTLIGGLAGGALGALAGTKLGETIGEYMSSFMATDKESTGFVNQLESAGIVKTSWMGDSEVSDWNKVALLNSKQLEAMIKYDDWDSETKNTLTDLMNAKKLKEGVQPADINEPNIVSQAANTDMKNINKAPLPSKETLANLGNNYTMAPPPPVIVNSGGKESKSKIDSFKQEDVQYLNDRGWGF